MIKQSARELSHYFGAVLSADFDFKDHVFPRFVAPIVGRSDEARVIKPYCYGLIPSFEKAVKPKMVFHNARVETLHEKPSFRRAFQSQRCLIPLNWFYEYIPSDGNKKKRVRFYPEDGSLLVAAGLYSRWSSPSGEIIPTFAMITRPAPSFISSLGHDRCPYFLLPGGFDAWLNGQGAGPPEWYATMELWRNDPAFGFDEAS